MDFEMQLLNVVILDRDGCYLGAAMDEDVALTLRAITSEDPSNWQQMTQNWGRYRTDAVPEFVSSLAIETVKHDYALNAIKEHASWMVIDLNDKRVLTGRDVRSVGRNRTYAMSADETSKHRMPLPIHLPQWWELHENVEVDQVHIGRVDAVNSPLANRSILFGSPMLKDFAIRILELAWSASTRLIESDDARYRMTIQVHRDWLMTRRADLNGATPRDLLHGAHSWHEKIVEGQRMRFTSGAPLVALVADVSDSCDLPMGADEVIVFFSLCRELIDAGWNWFLKHKPAANNTFEHRDRIQRQLFEHLLQVKRTWLKQSFEGGSSANFVIECNRRRVPRVMGVQVVGMDQVKPERHIVDCDCPICNMMAEGSFGPTFDYLSGYTLELDDEFAFSLCDTEAEWKLQQAEFQVEDDYEEGSQSQVRIAEEGEEDEDSMTGPFCLERMSVGRIPGDVDGQMGLAFQLANVISALQFEQATEEEVRQLNSAFSAFRKCDDIFSSYLANELVEQLESLAKRYPSIASRVSEFQSQIVENRQMAQRG